MNSRGVVIITVYMQLIISGILFGGVYALVSIGLTLIMGVMDLTNFAHGEFLMLSLYAVFWMVQILQADPYVSLLLVVPLMFLLGMVVERFLIRPTVGKPMFIHIFVTLGLSVVLQNVALMFWSGNFRTIQLPFASHTLILGELIISTPRLLIFFVTLLVALLIHLFLNHTWMGRAIRATSQNRNSAQLMGININRVFMITFGLGTACVGIAGPLLIPVYYVYPTVGFQFVLVAFVAVVMGGLGSVKGAVISSLLIGVIETLSGYFIDPAMKQAIYFLLFILVLIFKPSGLFGEEGKVA